MPAVPSAPSSFRVANRDVLSAANRTHSVGTSNQVPPRRVTVCLRSRSLSRRFKICPWADT
jgi:hypothetical protein